MKKVVYLSAFTFFAAILFFTLNTTSRSTGAPVDFSDKGYAGGTFENGRTCATTGCHVGGNPTSRDGLISTDVGAGGWSPGNTYNVAVNIDETGVSKFGFQATPQDETGAFAGNLISTGNETQVNGGYITHTSSGTAGSDSKTWNFEWESPQAGTGLVNFFVAVNATNSSGTSSGDQIYFDTVSIEESGSVGLSDVLSGDIDVYQHQNAGELIVSSEVQEIPGSHFNIYNMAGQVSKTGFVSFGENQRIDLTGVTSGLYIFQLRGAPSATTKFFVE